MVKTPGSQCRGAWVCPVRELRSCMPHGVAGKGEDINREEMAMRLTVEADT